MTDHEDPTPRPDGDVAWDAEDFSWDDPSDSPEVPGDVVPDGPGSDGPAAVDADAEEATPGASEAPTATAAGTSEGDGPWEAEDYSWDEPAPVVAVDALDEADTATPDTAPQSQADDPEVFEGPAGDGVSDSPTSPPVGSEPFVLFQGPILDLPRRSKVLLASTLSLLMVASTAVLGLHAWDEFGPTSSDECTVAMSALRLRMVEYPNGRSVTGAPAEEISAWVEQMHDHCVFADVVAFERAEFAPWLGTDPSELTSEQTPELPVAPSPSPAPQGDGFPAPPGLPTAPRPDSSASPSSS